MPQVQTQGEIMQVDKVLPRERISERVVVQMLVSVLSSECERHRWSCTDDHR